jgi:hypothetical protein
MKFEINNFAGGFPLTIKPAPPGDNGPIVYALQSIGSTYFQHSMTPTQARQMAAALIACAKDAEDAATNADFAAHREMIEVQA